MKTHGFGLISCPKPCKNHRFPCEIDAFQALQSARQLDLDLQTRRMLLEQKCLELQEKGQVEEAFKLFQELSEEPKNADLHGF